jgi:hypothetical protein
MPVQLTINFEPGLAERHKSLKGCVRERVYAHPTPLKALAADLDLSETELTRKLANNPNDTRNFNCDDLEAYLDSTKDLTPIYYLIEKYGVDSQAKQAYAAAELAKMLPQLIALAKAASK